jgi:hypothetical protein
VHPTGSAADALVGAVVCDQAVQGAEHAPAYRALACADGVVRWPADGPLRFVPDKLMDEPERTKAGLRDAYRRLLDLDFDRLLLAHGDPIAHGARTSSTRSSSAPKILPRGPTGARPATAQHPR